VILLKLRISVLSTQIKILDENDKNYGCNHCRRKVEDGICTFEGDEIQKDFIIYFTYKLDSKDWDGEVGTLLDEKRTKDMLLTDLREHLQDLVSKAHFLVSVILNYFPLIILITLSQIEDQARGLIFYQFQKCLPHQ